MPNRDYILAAGGEPFRDWDAAQVKCLRLVEDLADDTFHVVPHPDGGYAVTRKRLEQVEIGGILPARSAQSDLIDYSIPEGPGDALAREVADKRDLEAAPRYMADTPSVPILSDLTGNFPPHFALNVAPRAFLQLHLLTLLGVMLMLFPHWLLAPLGGFAGFQDPTLGASALGVIRLVAMVLGIGALSKFLYTYLLYRYEVTPDSVEANFGFIARDAPKVFFAHIRTTKVVQSWWQRLLMVGDVALGTGATDQHEVVLRHIANPKRVATELERRYVPYIRAVQPVVGATP